jgi:hypothetical protein
VKRATLLFLIVAMIYVAPAFLPGRTFAPLDIPFDLGAWNADAAVRMRPANSLLSDVVVQFAAWDEEVRRLLAEGELPWVNRLAGDGAPLFANLQTALFSPFTWPRLLFGLKGWAVMAVLKLLVAALCAYWFARELDILPSQALVSALVFATSATTIVWLLYPITNVFAFLPGLGAAALRLMKSPSLRNAALVILFAALCTAGGHPETLFVGVVAIWVFLGWEAEKRPGFGIRALFPSKVGALLGFLLLFVQHAPFFTLIRNSYASAMRPLLAHSFRPWALVSQILPGVLGSPLRGELDLTQVVAAEDFSHRTGGFVGALVLFALLIAWRSLTPSLQRGLMIGAVALILSWYPPGAWPLLRHFPVIRVVALEYGVVAFVLFASLAAGPAIVIAAARQRKKTGALLIVAGALLVIAGLLPALPSMQPALRNVARSGIAELRARGHLHQQPEVYEQRLAYYLDAAGATTLKRIAIPGALWLVAGFAFVLNVKRRAVLLSGVAIAELVAFGVGFNPVVRMTSLPPPPPALAGIDPRYLIASNLEVFPPNLGTLYGVHDVVSYDVLMSRARVEKLTTAGYNPLIHSFNPMLTPTETRALEALGVRYFIARGGVIELANAPTVPMPPNEPPPGLVTGAVVSLIAMVAALAWLRLYKLAPPVIEGAPRITPSPT